MEPILQVLLAFSLIVITAINVYIVLKKSRDNQYEKALSITRIKTIELMKNLGLKYKVNLPEFNAKNGIVKEKSAIIKRMLALHLSSAYAVEMIRLEKLDEDEINKKKQELLKDIGEYINKFKLHKFFEEEEKALFRKDFKLSDNTYRQLLEKIGWETDAVVILAYSLCLIDTPPLPDKKNSANKIFENLKTYETVEDIENICQFRSATEMNDWLDVFFQLDWITKKNKRKKKSFIVSEVLNSSLKAFIWLLDKNSNQWYEVNTNITNKN